MPKADDYEENQPWRQEEATRAIEVAFYVGVIVGAVAIILVWAVPLWLVNQ